MPFRLNGLPHIPEVHDAETLEGKFPDFKDRMRHKCEELLINCIERVRGLKIVFDLRSLISML